MLDAKTYLRLGVAGYASLILFGPFSGYSRVALAQSFDCGKASTTVETLICRNATLGDLDTKLNAVFRQRLAADPDKRAALLIDERAWVAQRDIGCLSTGGEVSASGQSDCLASAYRQRMAVLQTGAGDAPRPGNGLCEAIRRKYAAFLPTAETSDAQAVLNNLAQQPSSGVSVTGSLMDGVDGDNISKWAKDQDPPFAISPDLIDDIKNNADTNQTLDHPAGSNVYVVNGTAGTLYCYQPGVYFRVENGHAIATAGPQGWDGGDSCMVLRSVGTVDGTPAMFEETKNTSRIGEYSLSVVPWAGDHFGPGCTATFRFSQRAIALDQSNPEKEPDECKGNVCDKLKAAAWRLVVDVQAHAQSIGNWRKMQIAALTPVQAKQFKTMIADATNDTDNDAQAAKTISSSDDASALSPLLLPLVEGNRLYLVKAGHLQFRNINLPGWKIILQHLTNGRLDESDQASFDVDMRSDRLLGVAIK